MDDYSQNGVAAVVFRFSGGLVKWLLPLTVCLLLLALSGDCLSRHLISDRATRTHHLHPRAVAVVALAGYYVMAFAGAVSLVWRIKMADVTMRAVAPVGAALTAIALVTGAIWVSPLGVPGGFGMLVSRPC
ncbi:MAG: hypothetical protein CM15mP74_10210 [Halieaceae bacterium]|nr:MAG: hypothetical protein CM15mP74_10210 [Halieaceae bacterium]